MGRIEVAGIHLKSSRLNVDHDRFPTILRGSSGPDIPCVDKLAPPGKLLLAVALFNRGHWDLRRAKHTDSVQSHPILDGLDGFQGRSIRRLAGPGISG